MPVVVLSGARQTGKSTLLKASADLADRRYFDLDDFDHRQAFAANPRTLLSDPRPVIIDEVQRQPDLLRAIKVEVDRDRRPGRFLLSGSANLALLEGVTESLAGRSVWLELTPMSRREVRGRLDDPPFLPAFLDEPELPDGETEAVTGDEVLAGGMPQVALRQVEDPALWFRGYVQTYVERDVRNLARVGDLTSFRRLLQLTALRTGRLLNTSELARDAAIDQATAGRYLSLLEASFLVHRLPAWRGSRTTRLVKSPKLTFLDSGLAAAVAGVRSLAPLSNEPLRGPLFETWTAANVRAILARHRPDARLHHWSVQGRHEVDLVIEDGRHTVAVEVKAAERWGPSDLRGLRAFVDRTPSCRAAILAFNGRRAADLGGGLWAIPLGLLVS